MLSHPDEISSVFQGTALEGLPVTQVADSDVLVVDWPDPGDLLTGWRAARETMEVTGRRPVAFTPDFGGPLYFRRFGPSELADLETASAELDPWPALHAWEETADQVMETVTLENVSTALGTYIGEPEWFEPTLARELLPQIESPTTWNTLQYDLLELIVGRPDRLALMPGRDRPLRVYVPKRVQLALLPTTSPWLTALWALYSYQPKPKVLAACLRQWHQTWGAELVASWDCMLQLVTARRPEFGQESWDLARQHLALGRDLQIPQLSLARSLARGDTWFLKQF